MYSISKKIKGDIEDRLCLRLKNEDIELVDIIFKKDTVEVEVGLYMDKLLINQEDIQEEIDRINFIRERAVVNVSRVFNKYLDVYLELDCDEHCYEIGQANKLIFRFFK